MSEHGYGGWQQPGAGGYAPPGQPQGVGHHPPTVPPPGGHGAPPLQAPGPGRYVPPVQFGAGGGGFPGPGGPVQPERRGTSRVAVIAFVVGVVGFVFPFMGGAVAIILGLVAAIRISGSNGRRTGMGFAVAGLVLGALSIVGWALLLTSDGFQEGFEAGIDDLATSNILTVGDCLDVPVGDSDRFSVSESDVVPCAGPHAAEFIGTFEVPYADDAPYPGEDELFLEAFGDCVDLFADYTGTDFGQRLELDVLTAYPQSLGWRVFGDREVACYITSADGGPLTGSARG